MLVIFGYVKCSWYLPSIASYFIKIRKIFLKNVEDIHTNRFRNINSMHGGSNICNSYSDQVTYMTTGYTYVHINIYERG